MGGAAPAAAPVSAAGGATAEFAAPLQVPLSEVADVRVVEGPSMIKSENGMLRNYVQLNVRGRDIVGFVEDGKQLDSPTTRMMSGACPPPAPSV